MPGAELGTNWVLLPTTYVPGEMTHPPCLCSSTASHETENAPHFPSSRNKELYAVHFTQQAGWIPTSPGSISALVLSGIEGTPLTLQRSLTADKGPERLPPSAQSCGGSAICCCHTSSGLCAEVCGRLCLLETCALGSSFTTAWLAGFVPSTASHANPDMPGWGLVCLGTRAVHSPFRLAPCISRTLGATQPGHHAVPQLRVQKGLLSPLRALSLPSHVRTGSQGGGCV